MITTSDDWVCWVQVIVTKQDAACNYAESRVYLLECVLFLGFHSFKMYGEDSEELEWVPAACLETHSIL